MAFGTIAFGVFDKIRVFIIQTPVLESHIGLLPFNHAVCAVVQDEDDQIHLQPHYRIAFGPQAGRKVFTLQALPVCEAEGFADTAGKVSRFSLYAGVVAGIGLLDDAENSNLSVCFLQRRH